MNETCPSTASKSREREPCPLPPEPRKRRHVALGNVTSARTVSLSSRFQTEKKRKRSPALSSRSRTGRAPRAAEAPPLWIAWRGPRKKARRGERRKDKEGEEGVAAVQPTVQRPLSKPSLFLRPLLPPSFSSANLGDYLASSRYSTPAPWPKASNTPASEVVV
jgi:hypothetical protein